MPLQKAKFYVPSQHYLFTVAVKYRYLVVSQPTPFPILIIVELVVVMKYLTQDVKQPTINRFLFRSLQKGSFTCMERGILHTRHGQTFRIMTWQPSTRGLAYPPTGDRALSALWVKSWITLRNLVCRVNITFIVYDLTVLISLEN